MILIDLDNLFIVNNKVNIKVFKKRKILIEEKLGSDIYWFGNKVTAKIMKDNDIMLGQNFKVLDVQKDSADHDLVNFAFTKRHPSYTVVSNDKALLRLLFFLNEKEKKITFYSFTSKGLQKINKDVNICFKKKLDLTKFIQSYNLFKLKFGH